MTDGLAGDHSEGAAAGRAELDQRELEDFLHGVFERWDPDEERLADLEQLLDRDDELGGSDGAGLFSPMGGRAMRAAIVRQRSGG